MTGTFLKEGNSLRVTVQLIDVNKGEIISKFPFETKYEKLVTVQDQVAHYIIERLKLNLSPAEAELLQGQTTEDPRAYEYFLRGIDMYSRSQRKRATGLFKSMPNWNRINSTPTCTRASIRNSLPAYL